ncbi:GntR family transcriptional regulator [Bacillus sp. EAC]|uniref:GntR family transcriptional regulator n=1 Tax=Bacillus sp. EAC TaxID=1978338 RepID=UPI000B44FB19|nr:GntR family transcriptional regulator [Bacillus sp. EAC]
MFKLDKNSPLPIYFQIQEILKEKISSGEWNPGERIPSEQALSEMLNVSRMTIRQALNNLVKESLISRKRGIGTFVSVKDGIEVEESLQALRSFSEDISSIGMTPTNKLLGFSTTEADEYLAEVLSIECGSEVFKIERCRLANEHPIAIETTYIPKYLVNRIDEQVLNHSLYEYFEVSLGYSIKKATKWIKASLMSESDSLILEVAEESPALELHQITYINDDVPLEYVSCIYRADRYRFTIDIERT